MRHRDGITLSPQHGVNPCIPKCFFCGRDKNEILLLGRLPGDAEAPRGAVFNCEPCDKCAQHMRDGIILISCDPDRSPNMQEPWRTGGYAVVKEEAIRRMVDPPELCETICRKRAAFIDDATWTALGLPALQGAGHTA